MGFHEPEPGEIAVVREVRDGGVVIEIEKGGGCKSCAMSGICMGKDNVARHYVPTSRRLHVGDRVRFEVSPVARIGASLLLFLFPIVMLIAFYLVSRYAIGWSEDISILCSFGGLLASGFIIWRADKLLGHKASFEIVEILQHGGNNEDPSA